MKQVLFIFSLLLLFPFNSYSGYLTADQIAPSTLEKMKDAARKYKKPCVSFSLKVSLTDDSKQGCLILPTDDFYDAGFRVEAIAGDYVIYSLRTDYVKLRVAMPKQKGKSYPEKSGLDMNMYYIIDGTVPFKTVTGSTTELYKVVPVEKFEK